MGKLIQTNQALIGRGKRGRLVYDISREPELKTPGFNQPVVSYTDTDGKSKFVNVDADEYGGVLYNGKRFANGTDLVSALLTPTPAPTVTTPAPAAPKTPSAPPPVNLSNAFPVTEPVRAVTNYAGKALSGVGAAFANVAGDIAGLAESRQQRVGRAWDARMDAAAQRYLQADDDQKNKALKNYQNALSKANSARKQSESARETRNALYGISDELAARSGKFQKAAESHLPDVPTLRGALNVVTDLLPFFALNAIPYAGQVAAGAYLVGGATGDARRAGLSETSQAALGLASLLSMGAAGSVGKAVGNPKVTQWFLDKGLGPELARVLEHAAVSGLATGATRQTVSAAGQAYARAEQVKTAQSALDELSKMDISGFSSERKAAYDSAIAANQAILNAGYVDFTSIVAGIALEMALSIGGTAIAYRFGPNFQSAESEKNKPIRPEESEYFKGVSTPEEAKARLRELARRYHPDISDDPNATGIMQEINAEFDRLILDAQKVTETWRKAKAGGVTKAEADAANSAVAGLLQTARASGDAETVAALENILAPLAAEINAAPVVPEIPLTPQVSAAPETPVGVTNAPAVMEAPPVTQIPGAVTNAPDAATLPAFAPVPERKPFITFDDWRKQHPEFAASADAAAKEQLASITAQSDAAPSATVDKNPEIPQNKRGTNPQPPTPVPEARPAAPESGPMRELIDGLNASDRVDIGNVRFEIVRGLGSWRGQSQSALAEIRRITPGETDNVMNIRNADDELWREFFPTPEEALNS